MQDSEEESRFDVRMVVSHSLTLAQFSSNTLVKALEMTKLGYAQVKTLNKYWLYKPPSPSSKYVLSVCEKHQTTCQSSESTACSPSSPSYANLFFLPDRLGMFTMSLPLFLLTFHPYREPSSMYLFALWTCACLHGCALAQAGTWLL